MPLNLGNRVISQHLTIDEVDASIVKATQLGTADKPVQTIHRASTDIYRNDLKFQESTSGEVRAAIRTSGHLAVGEDVEFHSGTDVETTDVAWSCGTNATGRFNINQHLVDISSGTLTAVSRFMIESNGTAKLTAGGDPLLTGIVTSDRNEIVNNGTKIPDANAVSDKLVHEYMTISEIGSNYAPVYGNASNNFNCNDLTASSKVVTPSLTVSDSLIYGGDSQTSPPIALQIKNALETNTTDMLRIAPFNTGTARIDPEYNYIKFRTWGGSHDLLVRGEDKAYLVGGSATWNDAARITLHRVSNAPRVDIEGAVVANSTITCTSLTQTSDARLKSNITPISDALATIRKLSPQTYEKQGLLDAGFVAQDVETIPELASYVSTPEDETPKGLNYSALFSHAVAALQELDRIVQSQASTITALAARISALEVKK